MESKSISRPANFVGGGWVESVGGETETIVNPATAQPLAEVPAGSVEDVDRAVAAARNAFGRWRETTPAERSELLLELARRVDEHSAELIDIECANVGKPYLVAEPELPLCVDNLKFFAGAGRCQSGSPAGEFLSGYTSMVRREPLGVCAAVAPWNYPLMMAVWKLAPALAAGNTCVLKPSEETPLSTLRLAELAQDLFPPGVLNVITGHGDTVGAGLAGHPDVDLISLTGSVGTGQDVMRAASGSLARVHLELGGKAPVLVFGDADLEAVSLAVKTAGFWNSGQECAAACRVLVAEEVSDDLLTRLVPAVESLRVGPPSDGRDIEMGPLISAKHRDRVQTMVHNAIQGGAEPLAGDASLPDGPGWFLAPLLLTQVDQHAECVQEEIFGPVVSVQTFSDPAEAIALANDVKYGLSASVWTENISLALEATRKLEFGTVWVNDHLPLVSEMPFGGFKQSGHGKDMSLYALDAYTDIKHVMVKH